MSQAHPTQALFPRLLGDIGGTHARFAWMDKPGAPLSHVQTYRCAEHPTLGDAIQRYLNDRDPARPAACALGIANPVTGDEVRMTNHHWAFSITALQKELALQRLEVINDFTALALSLPSLGGADLQDLGGVRPAPEVLAQPQAPLALLGAGTGLGVSGLIPSAQGLVPLAGEGGHATLCAMDDEEDAVLALLRRSFGHVSAERALSGPGLLNLYRASARWLGLPEAAGMQPEQVLPRARAGDAVCQRAVDLFCRFLGSTAGNLALTLGATGGVYIGGGIAPRMLPELRASRFRERFEGKGRLQALLAPIPCFVISSPTSPALLGAARALDRRH
ncbi:glucokinase [Pelomonas sp. APW6]|uniref:Glucokinase n=1 Tax=Roseateles subflavus TaxID=3053353 RepID=A0ABT7LHP3_9BURK|nr:glucokinase [Pelomonas sp. APW6]MDL5031797.1 glucokinase [Pelomonas sp. APW6]